MDILELQVNATAKAVFQNIRSLTDTTASSMDLLPSLPSLKFQVSCAQR